MTTKQIEEFNELCAKLLGAELVFDDIENYPNGYWWGSNSELDIPSNLEDMQFHDNWNWLMCIKETICELPLIDEFNTKYDSIAKGYWCNILAASSDTFDDIYSPIYKTEIEATVYVIYQFLKWYNNSNNE